MLRFNTPICLLPGLLLLGCGAKNLLLGQTPQEFARMRAQMVELAVKGAGVTDPRVLKVMLSTPRHEFVPPRLRRTQAYLDAGIPIGEGQTISSPFIVAYMTQALDPQPTDRVLEIGTGSGYQAAILSPLVDQVYTIEIVESLGKQAERVLKKLNYENVHVKIGDGYLGWPEHSPFDKIIVTCSPENIPQPLVDQLKEGGLIVVPIGERHQQTLYLLQKKDGEMIRQPLQPTLFVPMTGLAEDKRQVLPDPRSPQLINGDFEDGLDEAGHVLGWYYERQLEWITDPNSPSGRHYVQFKSEVPGQLAQLMQAFAIDGEQVAVINFSGWFSCARVSRGPTAGELPAMLLTFWDENREKLGETVIGPFLGSRNWQFYQQQVRVPRGAKEAIVRIGLFGGIGTASFDNIAITPVQQRPARREQEGSSTEVQDDNLDSDQEPPNSTGKRQSADGKSGDH
jgi:protein-L-isoaspartate(D-aspartate) O-methyltransferase